MSDRASGLPATLAAGQAPAGHPSDHPAARIFLVALAALLAGYMFLGRGFAHLGVAPLYVGEAVLALGVVCTAMTVIARRLRPAPSLLLWLLLAFMALGAIDTIPHLGTYGMDAMRDGVLWGYGIFAVMVYLLADRSLVERVGRLYGRVLPVFAIWLPICWLLFRILSPSIDPERPGEVVPLIFFKNGDMAVHAVAGVAFLVLAMGVTATRQAFAGRVIVALPLLWTGYATATANRGSLLATVAGLAATAVLGFRSRTWRPVLLAAVILVVVIGPGAIADLQRCGQAPSPVPGASAQPTQVPVAGREVNPCQLLQNAGSILGSSSVSGLEGTKNFRLKWWGTIVDYTVTGPYFWTGKGFGINLADADGFQPTADHSLRAPHNSHVTALARMGVPGFILWVFLQGAFAIGLLRALLAHRRAGDGVVAGAAGWILVYWLAMMVNTSFDPFLEGPQGGIWFWVLFGLGMAIMRLTARRAET